MISNTNINTGHPWHNATSTLEIIGKLQSDQQFRYKSGTFFVEGIRNFVAANDCGHKLAAIIFSDRLLTSGLARKLVRRARRNGVPVVRVTPEQFRSVSQTERASGVGAIIRQRWTALHKLNPRSGLCWTILGNVRSPGNLGTLVRTSEAIGAAGFVLLDPQVDPFAPGVVRASMGAIFRQQFVRTKASKLQRWATQNQCHLIGASPDATEDFQQFQYPESCFIFLGEERGGLTNSERNLCHHLVRIPMVGASDSLNLGVAGSLMLYELFRARR